MAFWTKKKHPGKKENWQIPKHIGIIMDGNGRWAKKRGLPRSAGHKAGADTLKKIAEYCDSIGVEAITAYAFSTENWARPKEEVDALMNLLYDYLSNADKNLAGKNSVIRVVGNVDGLPERIRNKIGHAEEITKKNTGLILNLALNYGGREEITQAARILAKQVQQGQLQPEEITQDSISRHLYTSHVPDPDVIIRPSGELRLSNFMLWQAAYSEFWFSHINWPDFSPRDIDQMIADFQKRDRRYGGRSMKYGG